MNQTQIFLVALSIYCFLPTHSFAQTKLPAKGTTKISDLADGKLKVEINGHHFTTYDFKSQKKPIFYPVLGPQQLPMTRGFPMDTKPGEEKDHPHQKSIWTAHIINGVDFWTEKGGSVQHQKFLSKTDSEFTVRNHWKKKGKQKPILSDETTYRFGGNQDKTLRWLDAKIKFIASHRDVVFNDTKEGLFAIRTHPAFRITPFKKDNKKKKTDSKSEAINSAGETGKPIWGKKAKWVAYSGSLPNESGELQYRSIYFFDHPDNFRHPTTWQARDYGLVAANPFGLHYFQKKPKGFGAHKIKKGDSMTFRYRIVFHAPSEDSEKPTNKLQPELINSLFDEFANSK